MGQGEDSGKKGRIREFLNRISNGLGYIEDIWVDRQLQPPNSSGSYSSGRSLSGKPVHTLSGLLKDDIEHTFEQGLFTFRFIAAVPGSGKTTTLSYLKELIDNSSDHQKTAIVVNFAFNELLSQPGSQSFGVKFYSFLFLKTFWNILRQDISNPLDKIRDITKDFLIRITNKERVAQIEANADEEIIFAHKLNSILGGIEVNFKELFFSFIKYINKRESQVKFIYLIDELDALHNHTEYLNDARSILRDLINTAVEVQKIRLMLYIVGRKDDVQEFIKADEALHSRVSDSIIQLVPCRTDECRQIREKIESRLRDAYSGCKDFDKAWNDIKGIQLEVPHDFKTLRDFCKKYIQKVIEIHERSFKFFDESFNRYEDRAREIMEAEARKHWSKLANISSEEFSLSSTTSLYMGHSRWKEYKGKKDLSLLVSQTTTNYKGHNLDCYMELRHRNQVISHAFGEAKNYELIQEHLGTFFEWLEDFEYRKSSTSDLAFIIAPNCSEQKRLKLEKKGVYFVSVEKIRPEKTSRKVPNRQHSENSWNINDISQKELCEKFRGLHIRRKNLNDIFENRTYKNLDDLFEKVPLTAKTREKILFKYDNGEIQF